MYALIAAELGTGFWDTPVDLFGFLQVSPFFILILGIIIVLAIAGFILYGFIKELRKPQAPAKKSKKAKK